MVRGPFTRVGMLDVVPLGDRVKERVVHSGPVMVEVNVRMVISNYRRCFFGFLAEGLPPGRVRPPGGPEAAVSDRLIEAATSELTIAAAF